MDPQSSIDVARQAVNVVLLLSAPVLVVGVLVGLVVGILQAMTQIQDQTVLFVTKLVAAVLVISLCLPWLVEQISQYSRALIQEIPYHITDRQL